MTTLYAKECNIIPDKPEDDKFFNFDTDDEYPHISDVVLCSETSFHILRLGKKEKHGLEILLTLLKGALQFDYGYRTEAPVIINRYYSKLKRKNINFSLIDFDDYWIVSTIVIPL